MKKREIEQIINEACGIHRRFKKSDIFLKEDDTNGNDGIYVDPQDNSTGSKEGISTALNRAVTNNPTEHDFKVNASDFNGSTADDTIDVDINAKNSFDAERQIRNKMTNPAMQSLTNNGKAMMNVHIQDNKKSEEIVEGRKFKKKDFDKFIKNF